MIWMTDDPVRDADRWYEHEDLSDDELEERENEEIDFWYDYYSDI